MHFGRTLTFIDWGTGWQLNSLEISLIISSLGLTDLLFIKQCLDSTKECTLPCKENEWNVAEENQEENYGDKDAGNGLLSFQVHQNTWLNVR